MSNKIFALIRASTKGATKVQDAIAAAFNDGQHNDITEAADAIEAAYPVKKDEDGKDENRSDRNNLLSVLRVQLGRVGKALAEPIKLTVKKIEGVWTLVQGEAAKKGEAEEGEGSKASESGKGEKEQDAMWAAVEVTLANLANPAVLMAIRSGLDKLAKNPAK